MAQSVVHVQIKLNVLQEGVMFFSSLFRRKSNNAEHIYLWALEQAKQAQPQKFNAISKNEVERNAKFEIIAVYMSMAVWVLKNKNENNLIQQAQEYMVEDFDYSLREQGVGDLSVGKKVKMLMSAFYGRLQSYATAWQSNSLQNMEEALQRNHFCDDAEIKTWAQRFMNEAQNLNTQNISVFWQNNKAA